MQKSFPETKKALKPLIWLGLLAFTIPLIMYAYIGTYSRFQADDFCTAGNLKSANVVNAEYSTFQNVTWRFSYTLTTNAVHIADIDGTRFLPLIIILAISISLYLIYAQLTRLAGLTTPRSTAALIALMTSFFFFLLLPNRFQDLYWQSASLVYTFPLAILFCLISLILGWHLKPGNTIPRFAPWLAGALAFIIGGYSETVMAFQCGLLGLALAATLLFNHTPSRRLSTWVFIAGLIGSGISLLIFVTLAIGGIQNRMAGLPPAPGFFNLILLSLRFAADFIIQSFTGKPLPILVAIVTSSLLAYIKTSQNQNAAISTKFLIRALILLPVIGYLLTVCCTVPSVYAGGSYPAERAMAPSTMVLVGTIILWGITAGIVARRVISRPFLVIAAAFVLLAAFFYPIRTALLSQTDLQDAQTYATQWDKRHQYMLQAAEDGEHFVEVIGFNARFGVSDLRTDPLYWVNRCTAKYYGFTELRGR